MGKKDVSTTEVTCQLCKFEETCEKDKEVCYLFEIKDSIWCEKNKIFFDSEICAKASKEETVSISLNEPLSTIIKKMSFSPPETCLGCKQGLLMDNAWKKSKICKMKRLREKNHGQ